LADLRFAATAFHFRKRSTFGLRDERADTGFDFVVDVFFRRNA